MINETNLLSEREREILRLVATGLSNQQIANQLGISPNTVKVHLRNVFGKINVASRTEATMYAVRAGIVEIEKAQVVTAAVETGAQPDAPPDTRNTQPVTPAIAAPPLADVVSEPPAPTATSQAGAVEIVQPSVEPHVAQVVGSRTVPRRSMLMWLGLMLVSVLMIVVAVASARALGWGDGVPEPSAASSQGASRWKTLPSMPAPRAAFAIATITDQVFVIGGENESGVLGTVDRYNLTFESWTKLNAKPTPVTDVRAVVLGEKIYVPGGRTAADPQSVTARFERYDPLTDSWDQLADLPAPRSAYALAQIEGNLYLFGGWDGSSYRNEVFEFDPDANEWRERSPMPTARAYADAAVAATSANIHVLGGENSSGQLATDELYTPSREGEQPWSRRSPLPQARSRFSAAVDPVFARIFVLGGGEGAGALQYSPDLDRWESLSQPIEAIGSQPGVVQQAGSILVLGGKAEAGQYSANVQSYQAIYRNQTPLP